MPNTRELLIQVLVLLASIALLALGWASSELKVEFSLESKKGGKTEITGK
jgi:hypothetical protein